MNVRRAQWDRSSKTLVTHAELVREAKHLAVPLSDAEFKEKLITVFETH